MEARRGESCSFYVVKVPPSVFEIDPEVSIRVSLSPIISSALY